MEEMLNNKKHERRNYCKGSYGDYCGNYCSTCSILLQNILEEGL